MSSDIHFRVTVSISLLFLKIWNCVSLVVSAYWNIEVVLCHSHFIHFYWRQASPDKELMCGLIYLILDLRFWKKCVLKICGSTHIATFLLAVTHHNNALSLLPVLLSLQIPVSAYNSNPFAVSHHSQAKPSQSVNWGRRLARSASRRPPVCLPFLRLTALLGSVTDS